MKRLIVLVFIFALAFTGWSQKYKPLDCGVTLSLVPTMNENGTWAVNLRYATNDVYECSNYTLGVETFPGGGKVHIVINGMAEPKECDDILGPAMGSVNLTSLGNGAHKFTTMINRMVFRGTLTVTDTYYELKLDENTDRELLHIYNPRLNLIPKNTVWGRLEYTDPAMKEVSIQFMDDLKKEGAATTNLDIGNYGDFYLHIKGVTQEKPINSLKFEYPYVYHFDGDIERLRLLVDMYGQRYAGKLKISMVYSNGKRFNGGALN